MALRLRSASKGTDFANMRIVDAICEWPRADPKDLVAVINQLTRSLDGQFRARITDYDLFCVVLILNVPCHSQEYRFSTAQSTRRYLYLFVSARGKFRPVADSAMF